MAVKPTFRLSRKIPLGVCLSAVFLTSGVAAAQAPEPTGGEAPQSAAAAEQASTPRLIKFGGVLVDQAGQARTGPVLVTFAIYAEPEGGAPLWSETHMLEVGVNGRYEALLGSATAEGLPVELFASVEARWLGVQMAGEPELGPRVRFASVPYALKAEDATTLGGKPIGAFVLTEQVQTPEGRKHLGLPGPDETTDDFFVALADPGPGFISLATTGPPLRVNSTERVVNLNADSVDGLEGTAFAHLNAQNSFTSGQNIIGADFFSLIAENSNPRATGIFSITNSIEPNLFVANNGSGAGVFAQSRGAGLSGPALRADNVNSSGIGIWSTSNSVDANLVVANAGSGDLIRGFSSLSGDPVFSVANDGRVFAQSRGAGLSGSALRADNVNSSGIGIWSTSNSVDANLVVANAGSGDLIRGFSSLSGDPVFSVRNNGTTTMRALEIFGGSDLSERFEVSATSTSNGEARHEGIEPGMVVSIDADHPGKLLVSTTAHDHWVVGVISGAGGVKPGMLMGQSGSLADGDHAIALTGRVYCWAVTSNGSIEPGDLLTTSDIPGHAMKVTDHARAQGAVIGKAMTGLRAGKGLVLLLVTLQ